MSDIKPETKGSVVEAAKCRLNCPYDLPEDHLISEHPQPPFSSVVEASPRPWTVECHDARGDYVRVVLVSRNSKFESGYYVVAAEDMEIRREQAIADFKLIAALANGVHQPDVQTGLNLLRQLVGGKNALRVLDVFPCNNGEHDEGCECFWEQCEAWAREGNQYREPRANVLRRHS